MRAKAVKQGDGSWTISGEIKKLEQCIEEFRKLSPSINANAMLAFLLIASRPGITVGEVKDALGLYSSTTARVVGMLSEHHRGGEPGLDLIEHEEDIKDRRVKHLYLKPKGMRLWNAIKKVLNIN